MKPVESGSKTFSIKVTSLIFCKDWQILSGLEQYFFNLVTLNNSFLTK